MCRRRGSGARPGGRAGSGSRLFWFRAHPRDQVGAARTHRVGCGFGTTFRRLDSALWSGEATFASAEWDLISATQDLATRSVGDLSEAVVPACEVLEVEGDQWLNHIPLQVHNVDPGSVLVTVSNHRCVVRLEARRPNAAEVRVVRSPMVARAA